MMALRWAVEWYSQNHADGVTRYFMWTRHGPLLFDTRDECRAEIRKRWGYILTRPDLRKEPHGWRLPRAVKVSVVLSRV